MTIRPQGARQYRAPEHAGYTPEERRATLGYTAAEDLPGSHFHVYGDPSNKEAAAFTGTSRRRPAGFLSHDPERHTIDSVYVSPQFRGKGLADRMYQAAGSPAHSTELTEQGERFARQTGGAMPPKEQVNRREPLDEGIYQMMLPDFANWISESGRRVK